MSIFKKSQQQQDLFNNLIEKLDNINSSLMNYDDSYLDLSAIKKIKENFIAKTNDFFKENRKLNIGIIGQVKAGKSSFLNTMIFNGMEILPKAATPKTATLTKIEYSERNFIEIEYYSIDEWKMLEEKAKDSSEIDEIVVAKEIMSIVRENRINPYEYLEKGQDIIAFNSYDKLMEELNNYVGDDGKLTPLVKSVKLNINREELNEISIVDTPGLNDPILSRSEKTRQFIEMCDVVFFLSRASVFLDKNDVDLLKLQLPQKGVKRLVLICSRYDDGLADTIYDKGGLLEADIDTKNRLKRHAKNTFDRVITEESSREANSEYIKIISECRNPIFASAMTHNMACKSREEYNDEEDNVYENLNVYDELNSDVLRKIGNIDEVKTIFDEVILQKEDTLLKKSQSFIPDTMMEVKNELLLIKQTIEKRVNLLSNNDKEQLANQKKYMASQINNIKANIENIFGELNIKLEQSKAEALRDLREAVRQYSNLSEKMGTETHFNTYTVSTSKWYNPITWGTSRTEHYSYEERYYYLDASDALENIRNFGNDSSNSIEDMFYNSIDMANLKRKLLKVIVENFDTSDENYDPTYFKLLAEKTLNTIELPIIKIDVTDFLNSIADKFSGETRNSSEKSNLKSILANTISSIFDKISGKFVEELIKFKGKMEEIKLGFSDKLLENINAEFDLVLEQFKNKEDEIIKGKEFILQVTRIIEESKEK